VYLSVFSVPQYIYLYSQIEDLNAKEVLPAVICMCSLMTGTSFEIEQQFL